MPRFPVLSGKRLIALLRKAGFDVVRQKGSHVSLQKGRFKTVVPLHPDLSKGTLMDILKQCNLTKDDLTRLLRES